MLAAELDPQNRERRTTRAFLLRPLSVNVVASAKLRRGRRSAWKHLRSRTPLWLIADDTGLRSASSRSGTHGRSLNYSLEQPRKTNEVPRGVGQGSSASSETMVDDPSPRNSAGDCDLLRARSPSDSVLFGGPYSLWTKRSRRTTGLSASNVIELVAKLKEFGRGQGVIVIAEQTRPAQRHIARGLRTINSLKKRWRSTSGESVVKCDRLVRRAPEWRKLTEHRSETKSSRESHDTTKRDFSSSADQEEQELQPVRDDVTLRSRLALESDG